MNTFGRIFRVSIFGESHGPQIGVIIDGVPEGIQLSEQDFAADIARRAAGASGTTSRREEDEPRIVSGIFDGHTTGAPLTIIFDNTDARGGDYQQFDAIPRPGHADYVSSVKWDWANDPRGGGQFSGRMTLPIVAAGTVAKKVLEGMEIKARLVEVGGVGETAASGMPAGSGDAEAVGVALGSGGALGSGVTSTGGVAPSCGVAHGTGVAAWDALIAAAEAEGDSLGGIIECIVDNVPIGLGEPFWDSAESLISHAVFSIPGIRGIEFGDGFKAAAMKGSEHNDPFGPDGPVKNGSGGINGGITNGAPVKFRVAVKPTSSIRKPQQTWNFEKEENDTLVIHGRHDTCFALRTPVIVEAMTAIVLADLV